MIKSTSFVWSLIVDRSIFTSLLGRFLFRFYLKKENKKKQQQKANISSVVRSDNNKREDRNFLGNKTSSKAWNSEWDAMKRTRDHDVLCSTRFAYRSTILSFLYFFYIYIHLKKKFLFQNSTTTFFRSLNIQHIYIYTYLYIVFLICI